MVVLRDIDVKFFTDLNFCNKKLGIDFIKSHGKTGKDFNNLKELKKFIKMKQDEQLIKKADSILLKKNKKNRLLKYQYNELKKIIRLNFPKVSTQVLKKNPQIKEIKYLGLSKMDKHIDGNDLYEITNLYFYNLKHSKYFNKNKELFSGMFDKINDYLDQNNINRFEVEI